MFADEIKDAVSIQIKAKKTVAGGSVEGFHKEGDYIIYSILIENSFYNDNDELTLEFEGDIIVYNENGSSHSTCTRLSPLTFSLEGVTNENDFSVKILKYIDDLNYSTMTTGMLSRAKVEPSKLLWLDKEKLAKLGINDDRLVTTNVEIEFVKYH